MVPVFIGLEFDPMVQPLGYTELPHPMTEVLTCTLSKGLHCLSRAAAACRRARARAQTVRSRHAQEQT